MSKPTKRLGRGLSSLLRSDLQPTIEDATTRNVPAVDSPLDQALRISGPDHRPSATARMMTIPLERIRRNPMQPRRGFDENSLQRLAESLKSRGALQPVIVRVSGDGYELVAGERRFRAAKAAGLTEIPAIVRSVRDEELLELALIENIHRDDLNPVERARAYEVMHKGQGLSHEEIASRTGEDRATVANYLRLLTLPESVLNMLASGALSTGHAKAILSAPDSEAQIWLAERISHEAWSVRRAEQEAGAARDAGPRRAASKEKSPSRPAVSDMEDRLSEVMGTRVSIREGRRRHSGRIVIAYYNLDDFHRVAARLGVDVENM